MKYAVVVYRSRHGATKQYAEWLSEKLDCPIYDVNQINASQLLAYHTIIYGSPLYTRKMDGVKQLVDFYDRLKDRTLVSFTVGLADPDQTAYYDMVIDANIPREMQENIHFFHLPGKVDYSTVGLGAKLRAGFYRFLIRLLVRPEKRDYELNMMLAPAQNVDLMDESSLEPLIDFVRTTPAANE